MEALAKFLDQRAKAHEGALVSMISREPSAKLRHFAKEHSSLMFLLSDDPEDNTRNCNSTLIYRHIAHPNKPCMRETIAPSLHAVRGYVCSTVEDLLAAYTALRQEWIATGGKSAAAGNNSTTSSLLAGDAAFGDANITSSKDGLPTSTVMMMTAAKIHASNTTDAPALTFPDATYSSHIPPSSKDSFEGLQQATQSTEASSPYWSGKVLLRPIKRQGSDNDLLLSSAQELMMYDFPFGDVVLEQWEKYDLGEDGLQLWHSVCFMHGKVFSVVDLLCFGFSKQGAQTSRASPEVQEHLIACTSAILGDPRVAGASAGTFEFSVLRGQPVLRKISMGLSSEHVLHYFLDLYAPNRHFLFWRSVVQAQLDIWAVWFRLYDKGIAFIPGKKRSTFGVFPLLYLREGVCGYFVAIGDTAADVQSNRTTAEEAFREPIVEQPLQRVTFSPDVRRIWCGSARPEYRRETQRYNLPNRCLPLVRPNKDYIVLPGGHKPTREWWRFCKDILGLAEDQVFFTSGSKFVMDDDMTEDVVSRIKAVVAKNQRGAFTLVPYCVTANFERWANQLRDLGVTLFGETFEWVQMYGHKGILHRHIKSLDEPCFIEKVAPNVRVAKGFTCSTTEDLVKAYELIGTLDVVIKPIFGAAGEGIKFVKGSDPLKVYDFPMGDVVLEEFLNLDKTEDGIVLSPAVHYMGNAFVGEGLVDQIMVGTGYMGWRRSRASKAFQKTVFKSTEKIIKAMSPNGPGGFDFLSVDGLAFLSDINTGRFNGAHFPKLFREMYAPGAEFYCWKFKPPASLTIDAFWGRLQSSGIAFMPGKSSYGVFPLTYLRGLSGLYIALAPTDAEAEAIYLTAKRCLTERATLQPKKSFPSGTAATPAIQVQPRSSCKLTLIKNLDLIYAPQPLEFRHILVAGTKISGLLNDEDAAQLEAFVLASSGTVVDGKGCIAVPGLVDIHEHICGGGGELGPGSRTREAKVSDLINAGKKRRGGGRSIRIR